MSDRILILEGGHNSGKTAAMAVALTNILSSFELSCTETERLQQILETKPLSKRITEIPRLPNLPLTRAERRAKQRKGLM